MVILTVENCAYDLNYAMDESKDIYFSILDNTKPTQPDFFFNKLILLECFNSPAIVLNIGGHPVSMPLDWLMLSGDPESYSDLELITLTSLNERGIEAFVYNPISDYRHDFLPVEILTVYQNIKWFFPRLSANKLLTVPISKGDEPDCVYFASPTYKCHDSVSLGDLL